MSAKITAARDQKHPEWIGNPWDGETPVVDLGQNHDKT
jgi:hypothetical protein